MDEKKRIQVNYLFFSERNTTVLAPPEDTSPRALCRFKDMRPDERGDHFHKCPKQSSVPLTGCEMLPHNDNIEDNFSQ